MKRVWPNLPKRNGSVLLIGCALLFLFASTPVSTDAQTNHASILERRVEHFESTDEPVHVAIGRLQAAVPELIICLEEPFFESFQDPTDRWGVSVPPMENASVSSVLDAITAGIPPGSYTWSASPAHAGVIRIGPEDKSDTHQWLDIVLPWIKMDNVTLRDAVSTLFNAPELNSVTLGGAGATRPYSGISIDLQNVTVREALTEIVLATNWGIGWSVGGVSSAAPMLSFGRYGGEFPFPDREEPKPFGFHPSPTEEADPAHQALKSSRSQLYDRIEELGGEWVDFRNDPEAMALIRDAQRLEGNFMTREAVEKYENVLSLDPGSERNAAIEFRIADIYNYIEHDAWTPNPSEAIGRYEKIIAKYSDLRSEVIRSISHLAHMNYVREDFEKCRDNLQALMDAKSKKDIDSTAYPEIASIWIELLCTDAEERFHHSIQRELMINDPIKIDSSDVSDLIGEIE